MQNENQLRFAFRPNLSRRKIAAGLILLIFSSCVRETVVYRPVPMQLTAENRIRIESAFQSLKEKEEKLKTIEAGADEPLISETRNSFLIQREYFQAFIEKDLELSRLALMFQAVLDSFFEVQK